MKLLEKLLPKPVTVEEIHAEFDSGEQRILDECDKILQELKILTESKIERKAKILEELGFINSETVHQAKRFWERNKEIEQKIAITSKQAETIKYFKQKYPFEKFITVEELDRICNKYNLIHAPVANYIKDIPEKNVLEMKNCKRLNSEDKEEVSIKLIGLESDYLLKLFGKKEPIFSLSDLQRINYCYKDNLNYWFLQGATTWAHCAMEGIDGKKGETPDFSKYEFKAIEKIDKSGLFIAAPKSHFNLEGLNKKSKYGFFKTEILEVKDPVVFEYCREGLVRIVSKWGTENDKAYLDPILQNEILN